MSSTTHAADLAECVVPLDDEGRRAVRRYWEQVIREEWVPATRRAPRAVPLAEDGRRERREARRAVARIAAAGRVAPVVTLRPSATSATSATSVTTVGEAA
ncbi:MAG: hypothetical protein ACT4RN_09695 [Pseudonocardia sp.]